MTEQTYAVVTVRGQAELEVPPDRAGLTCTALALENSADRVRAQLAAASGALQQVQQRFAAALERAETSGLQVSPVFSRRHPGSVTGWSGRLSTTLVLSDLEALGTLLPALTGLPRLQVDGPWWSLSAAHPAHREARLAAVADARSRAADYAAAFGRELGDLVEVSDGDLAPVPMPAMQAFARAEFATDDVLDLQPAAQRVSAQVSVRFRLAGPARG